MNYLKGFAGVLLTGAISVLTLASTVSAQSAEKYVNVGSDSDDVPYLLDTATMGKRERGFGSVLKVYQMKNNLMSEILLQASCGDERLSVVGLRTYSENGIKLTEDKVRQPLQVRTNSPGSQAMIYYCRSAHARGW
jgi:hypothetical protein